MKSRAPADGRALFLHVWCLAMRYRRDITAVNSCPQSYLLSFIAHPPALLQVLFPELLSLVEPARVRGDNYRYWRSRSSWAVRCIDKGTLMGLYVITVFDGQRSVR